MAKPFCIELDYYLQAYRLHQRMTQAANEEVQELLTGLHMPRAHGLLMFTQLIAKLNGWMDWPTAQAALANVRDDIEDRDGQEILGQEPLAPAIAKINLLNDESSLNDTMNGLMGYHSALAVSLDPQDFDNQWSQGTMLLYTGDPDGAYDSYGEAQGSASGGKAPHISRNSLKVDRADRKYFVADKGDSAAVGVAIGMIQEAILDAKKFSTEDTKWRRWNWSLGWAFYEAGDYPQSLATLLQIHNPHDLIIKNIIATYVALEKVEQATELAVGFLSRNPGYTTAMEDHWPYLDDARREDFKDHLRKAGLPDPYP